MYIKDSEYEMKINNKRIVFTDRIKTIIEFNNLVIVLLLDKQYKPNNVVAYNNNGDKVWEINDILMIKKPSGFDEIEKKSDTTLSAYCITGILYDIDIANKKMVNSVFLGQFDFLEEKIREESRKLIWQTEPILSEDKCIIHGGVRQLKTLEEKSSYPLAQKK